MKINGEPATNEPQLAGVLITSIILMQSYLFTNEKIDETQTLWHLTIGELKNIHTDLSKMLFDVL